jgi:hypothetical protein
MNALHSRMPSQSRIVPSRQTERPATGAELSRLDDESRCRDAQDGTDELHGFDETIHSGEFLLSPLSLLITRGAYGKPAAGARATATAADQFSELLSGIVRFDHISDLARTDRMMLQSVHPATPEEAQQDAE